MAEINFDYTEESIRSLDWREHIRLRPGMYIGKLGDGSSPDDGIYVLVKEVIDNCIDEHTMGYGKHVDINIQGKTVTVRDYGRGIPLELDGKLDRGHGMASMKHRAKQLQGQCLVESGPGYGTVIRLSVPL